MSVTSMNLASKNVHPIPLDMNLNPILSEIAFPSAIASCKLTLSDADI